MPENTHTYMYIPWIAFSNSKGKAGVVVKTGRHEECLYV